MGKKRQINGRNVVNDLRSGMADWELRTKYRLSTNSLRTIFEKLVAYNAVSRSELCEMSPFYKVTMDLTKARKYRRVALNLSVPVYDIESSSTGILRDVSENGLRVAGIETDVGQTKAFQIPIDLFMQVDPLLIVAECKWVKTKGKTKKYVVGGYEILDLSESDRESLRNVIKSLVLSESAEWKMSNSAGGPLLPEMKAAAFA